MMGDLSLGRRKGVDDFEAISAWYNVSTSNFTSMENTAEIGI
jgi:hypothetical protein